MAEYDNNLSGMLFKTQEKRTDKSPDNYGNCEIDGKKYKISGWVRTNARGNFISLRFQEDGQTAAPARQAPAADDFFGSSGEQSTQRQAATPRPKSAAEKAFDAQNSRPAPNFSGMDDDIPF